MYRIGNMRALAEAILTQAEREGNEAEHYLGIKLVTLAREEGLTEDAIIDAVSSPRIKLDIGKPTVEACLGGGNPHTLCACTRCRRARARVTL
jgi:hypothetical protein